MRMKLSVVALGAACLLTAPASAEPARGTVSVKAPHTHVSVAGRGERSTKSAHRHRSVTVNAPTTRVETNRGRVVVDAPFTSVRRSKHGIRVVAPFVDLYVRR